eukprot:355639-Chlamydomonas_euryale.AAC.3
MQAGRARRAPGVRGVGSVNDAGGAGKVWEASSASGQHAEESERLTGGWCLCTRRTRQLLGSCKPVGNSMLQHDKCARATPG